MGYRTLSDAELDSLGQECEQRVMQLRVQGIPVGGEGEHFIMSMLEVMLSSTQFKIAKEIHFLWLRDQLDMAEERIREAKTRAILGVNQ